MKYSTRKSILQKVEEVADEITLILEENRYYPSIREAGTTPSETGIELVNEQILLLLEEYGTTTIEHDDLNMPVSLEKIISEIVENQETNTADEFDELTEIDSFVRDGGERKYRYLNTVYQYRKTETFIAVEDQRYVEGGGDESTCSISVSYTEKKEKISYEWS